MSETPRKPRAKIGRRIQNVVTSLIFCSIVPLLLHLGGSDDIYYQLGFYGCGLGMIISLGLGIFYLNRDPKLFQESFIVFLIGAAIVLLGFMSVF